MLRSRPADDGDILTAAQSASGGWGTPGTETEERLERRHRGSPAIMAEDEFIEVDVQFCAADTVMRADQPLLQIADGAVGQGDDRRDASTQGRASRLLLRDMAIAGDRLGAKTGSGRRYTGWRRAPHAPPGTPSRWPLDCPRSPPCARGR
jgi:hypothetical protein